MWVRRFPVIFTSRVARQKMVCQPDGRELPYTVVAPQAFTVSTSPMMNIVSCEIMEENIQNKRMDKLKIENCPEFG